MNISVLMVVKNEQAHILDALRSLLRQTLQPKEVLIIDHQSEDQTFTIIKNFQKAHPTFPLKVVQRSGNHLGRSRQELLSHAQFPYVAFIDGDCEAPKNWLKQLAVALQIESQKNPLLAGVGGPNRLPCSTEIHQAINLSLDSLLGDLSKSPQAYKPKVPSKVNHLATTNALFIKSALIRIGGFSAKFSAYGEDLELGLRLTDRGSELLLLPEPVVINHCAKNFGEWLARMFRFGKAQGHLLLLRGWLKPLPLIPFLFAPVLLVGLLAGVFFSVVFKVIAFYILLTLVFSFGWTGLKATTKLGLPFWINLNLSPLAYSLGFWQVLILRFREHLMTNVFAHLKTWPANAFSLGVGLFQRFRQIRPNSH